MKNRKIAVYITGGIASYKAVSLVRLFIKEGAFVKVAMTNAAQKFITPLTFETLTRNKVYTNLFEDKEYESYVPHIDLADWSDFSVIIPATANIISKIAHGIADDFVTTAILASNQRKFVIPAMNEKMWDNIATKRNVLQLKNDGLHVLNPEYGFLAEGYAGKGRLPEPETIFNWIKEKLNNDKTYFGKNILISAGATREAIDPVRYITNKSSGKMGYALALAAKQKGAKVTLVSGITSLSPIKGITTINVESSSEMSLEMKKNFHKSDIVIMAAAVSDYRVSNVSEQKIKKEKEFLELKLIKNEDILKSLGTIKKKQILVGFAAETQNLIENAQNKLLSKNLDALIANDVSRKDIGFESNENEVIFLSREKKPVKILKKRKLKIAEEILNLINKL